MFYAAELGTYTTICSSADSVYQPLHRRSYKPWKKTAISPLRCDDGEIDCQLNNNVSWKKDNNQVNLVIFLQFNHQSALVFWIEFPIDQFGLQSIIKPFRATTQSFRQKFRVNRLSIHAHNGAEFLLHKQRLNVVAKDWKLISGFWRHRSRDFVHSLIWQRTYSFCAVTNWLIVDFHQDCFARENILCFWYQP